MGTAAAPPRDPGYKPITPVARSPGNRAMGGTVKESVIHEGAPVRPATRYYDMSNDASDLSALRAGQQDAFARLYQRHAAVVLSLCRRCSNISEAEDAMQETFLRAYRRLHQLRRPEGFRSWLYAIARRVCSERRRSAERRSRHEASAMENHASFADEPATPAEAVEHADQLDRLTAAIGELPDDERLAIHLHYLDDDPLPAASQALGLSRSGFYRKLTRARKRLAVAMRETQPI